jgi:hypothetical protein
MTEYLLKGNEREHTVVVKKWTNKNTEGEGDADPRHNWKTRTQGRGGYLYTHELAALGHLGPVSSPLMLNTYLHITEQWTSRRMRFASDKSRYTIDQDP